MNAQRLLFLLSDGNFHSGEAIADTLNVSRTAVWKYMDKLRASGADVYSVKGKGYKIPGGLDLLDKTIILEQLSAWVESENLYVLTSIASTNQFLISQTSKHELQVCTAEFQSSGRGRLGRIWHSPFARNIYLSLRKRVPLSVEALSGFSLAIGCAAAECFNELGANSIKLKWPNDLKIESKKVGGILVELVSHNEHETDIVIGIGINWDMPDEQPIDQVWANLSPYCTSATSRNDVVSTLVKSISVAIDTFVQDGFIAFKSLWSNYDEYLNKVVKLQSGKNSISGIYKGINDVGAVLIEKNEVITSYSGGELSLREIP